MKAATLKLRRYLRLKKLEKRLWNIDGIKNYRLHWKVLMRLKPALDAAILETLEATNYCDDCGKYGHLGHAGLDWVKNGVFCRSCIYQGRFMSHKYNLQMKYRESLQVDKTAP